MTDPIYSLTFFPSLTETIPSVEYARLTARRVIEYMAPTDGPRILTEKAHAPFFVTCLLSVGPYVGKTARRFRAGAEGQQRSGAHVTEAAWWAFDLDDITSEDMSTVLRTLDGMVFCAFSTHSHGREPGMVRMRVLVFADRALAPTEWTMAWHVINKHVFSGTADTATARMHQAAAVWCSHPDRVSQSFRHVAYGRPLSADKLLALAPKPQPKPSRLPFLPTTGRNQMPRYADALRWLDAGDYDVWQSVRMALRAAVELGAIDDAAGRALWLTWSATAPLERQSRNGQPQYDPAAMWDRRPRLTTQAHVLAGALFAKARDSAERCVRAEMSGPRSARGRQAEQYLRTHHRRLFEQMGAAA
jgi:hypothetical protein